MIGNKLTTVVLLGALAAFIAAQSPSDDKWLMACDGGDAKCVCPDHPGLHADPLANCTQFYECNNDGSGFYKSCPPPLLFNDDSGLCDWPDNVICESETSAAMTLPEAVALPAAPPTPAGRAALTCASVNATTNVADAVEGCAGYAACLAGGRGYYLTCPDGQAFDQEIQQCEAAGDVQCGGAAATPSADAFSSPYDARNTTFAVYFQTWSEAWTADPSAMQLAKLPCFMNMVLLAFARPDCSYDPSSESMADTGLGFSQSPATVRGAVAALKERCPATRVLLSVGGASYTNFARMNTEAIALLVEDLGLDGADLDFEPSSPGCQYGADRPVSCASDGTYASAIAALRVALPRPLLLTAAVWSVGAYGEGAWAAAVPVSAHTGMAVAALRAEGAALDGLMVMSYDAGSVYSPQDAGLAFEARFDGPVLLGVEVPPEAWGGHESGAAEMEMLARVVRQERLGGVVLWALQKATEGHVSAADLVPPLCKGLELEGCDQAW